MPFERSLDPRNGLSLKNNFLIQHLRKILFPFSWLYAIVVYVRGYLYDSCLLSSENTDISLTISVGNITVGGTGKTPVAAFYIQKYLAEGKKVAYLSRGYGRKTKGFLEVKNSEGNAEVYGDEAFMIKNTFPQIPVAVCEKRIEGAKKLKDLYEIDVLILDDAFQHRQVYRDVDIVVIDAQRPPWKDRLLPSGNLRESLAALYRADEIIVNKLTNTAQKNEIISQLKPYISATTYISFCTPKLSIGKKIGNSSEQISLTALKSAIVFSGIGNNEFFLQQIQEKKIEVLQFLPFADHYYYQASDIQTLIEAYQKHHPQAVLTTEKDYFRLLAYQELQDFPFYFVPMELDWL